MTDVLWELGHLPSSSLPTLPVQGQSLSWDTLEVGAQAPNSLADGAQLLGETWEGQRCDRQAASTRRPSPGSTCSEKKKKRGPRPRLFRKYACMVDGCASDLSTSSYYYQRNHICTEHLKLSCIQVRGVPSRFCQRCGISHDVDSFDGRKKSCRASLEKHKKRRLGKQSADGVADNSSPSTSHPTTPAATLTLSSPALEQPELGSLVPAATPDAGATGTPFPAVAVLEPLLGSPAALALGSRSSSSLEDLPGLSAAGIAPVAAKTAAGQPQLQEPQDALCVALLGELELPSLEDLESLDWDQLGCPMPGGDSAGRQVAVGSEVIGAEGGSLAEPALFSGVEVPAGALAASGSDQAAVGGEHWGGASQPAGQPLTPRHGGDALAAQGSLPTPGGSLLSSPDSQAFWGGCEVGLPRVPAVAATAAAAGGAANFNPQPTWAGQQVRAIEPTELTAAQWYPPAQQQHQQQGCLHPTAVAAAAAPTALTAPWSQACQPPSLGRQDQPQSPAQPQAGQYMSAQQLSPLQVSFVQGTNSAGQPVLGTAWVLVPQALMVHV